MWESPVSSVQMKPILDCAPIAVAVTALESGELLYHNPIALKLIQQEEFKRIKGSGDVAPNVNIFCCPTEHPSHGNPETWERKDPENNRTYRYTGTALHWDETPAQLIYMQEISECGEEEVSSQMTGHYQEEFFRDIPCGLGIYRIEGERILPQYYNPAFWDTLGYRPYPPGHAPHRRASGRHAASKRKAGPVTPSG